VLLCTLVMNVAGCICCCCRMPPRRLAWTSHTAAVQVIGPTSAADGLLSARYCFAALWIATGSWLQAACICFQHEYLRIHSIQGLLL
jgi:hypothetical protein